MSVTKAQVLAEILRLAKAKQGNEAEKCVELSAATRLNDLPKIVEKSRAIDDVAAALAAKYDVTFPTDVRTLGTIDAAAQYIVDNTER